MGGVEALWEMRVVVNKQGDKYFSLFVFSLLFADFEKKGKKEVCPVLDQFLCHVAKTGETM